MKNIERAVLKMPLSFEEVINESIGMCEHTNREIIVVGRYSQYLTYLRVKYGIKKLKPLIKVSYNRKRPEINLSYYKGPYLIEIDCFEFEKE